MVANWRTLQLVAMHPTLVMGVLEAGAMLVLLAALVRSAVGAQMVAQTE